MTTLPTFKQRKVNKRDIKWPTSQIQTLKSKGIWEPDKISKCQGLTAQGATSSTPVLFFSRAHSRFLPHLATWLISWHGELRIPRENRADGRKVLLVVNSESRACDDPCLPLPNQGVLYWYYWMGMTECHRRRRNHVRYVIGETDRCKTRRTRWTTYTTTFARRKQAITCS